MHVLPSKTIVLQNASTGRSERPTEHRAHKLQYQVLGLGRSILLP
jgi:hypothetical protein